MSTRGAIGFYRNGEHKVTYNHSDSYPDGLGKKMLEYLNEFSIEELNNHFNSIELVNENEVPTAEQIERCEQSCSVDLDVGEQTVDDWYCLLQNAQGDLSCYSAIGFMINNKAFLHDGLFCEYAYIINLDDNTLEFYEGYQKSKPIGRYMDIEPNVNGCYAVGLIKETPIADLNKLTFKEVFPVEEE